MEGIFVLVVLLNSDILTYPIIILVTGKPLVKGCCGTIQTSADLVYMMQFPIKVSRPFKFFGKVMVCFIFLF